MKIFLTALIFLAPLSLFALDKGLYECTNGNEASICPQTVIPELKDKELLSLKIYYSGYCNDQGPYYYDCENNICGDGAIEFSNIKKDSFHWENIPHGFFCDFKKASSVR